ncbi:MAG: heme exporter protein CcmD [Pseudomonadota bacterium]
MLEGLSHAPFITASYVIFFIVLGGLAVVTFRRARETSKYLRQHDETVHGGHDVAQS